MICTTSSRENYGDNAIGYVCLKREDTICTMKCQMCPEHRVHSKGYTVVLVVNEDKEEITSVDCQDCTCIFKLFINNF